MSVTGTPATITQTPKWRTLSAVISTPRGSTDNDNSKYMLTILRERLMIDQDGNVVPGRSQGVAPVQISAASIADQSFTVGDVTMTGAQLETMLEGIFDQLATAAGVDV